MLCSSEAEIKQTAIAGVRPDRVVRPEACARQLILTAFTRERGSQRDRQTDRLPSPPKDEPVFAQEDEPVFFTD